MKRKSRNGLAGNLLAFWMIPAQGNPRLNPRRARETLPLSWMTLPCPGTDVSTSKNGWGEEREGKRWIGQIKLIVKIISTLILARRSCTAQANHIIRSQGRGFLHRSRRSPLPGWIRPPTWSFAISKGEYDRTGSWYGWARMVFACWAWAQPST